MQRALPRPDAHADATATEHEQRLQVEVAAAAQTQERQLWEQLAQAEEAERKRLEAEFDRELKAILESPQAAAGKPPLALRQAIQQATGVIDLDEAETRDLRPEGANGHHARQRYPGACGDGAGHGQPPVRW